MCVFSWSQSHCPSALASLPPPLCASLFTGNAGEPYGWLGWCEVTWRLQRAGNLACQAGQHGASRQSIKYSIQHSQFMDLIPQKKTPSKITKRNRPLAPPHLLGAVWVYQNWSWKKKSALSMETRVWRQSCSGIILVRGLIDFHPPLLVSGRRIWPYWERKFKSAVWPFLSDALVPHTQ